jgi:hypothetical protein
VVRPAGVVTGVVCLDVAVIRFWVLEDVGEGQGFAKGTESHGCEMALRQEENDKQKSEKQDVAVVHASER